MKSFEQKHSLSLSFVEKYFGNTEKIHISAVEETLISMEKETEDRLKMAVLYLIGSVIKRRKNKTTSFIDPFFLKVVDNLSLCEGFPWGTLTFRDRLSDLQDMMTNFKGEVTKRWAFTGFITPLEVISASDV